MTPPESTRRIFSLAEARTLLPEVKTITADAVRHVDELTRRLQRVPDSDPSRASIESSIETAIHDWTRAIERLGLEAKGLWLVDFDNGQGYYCWCYPEQTVSHFHDYDAGFRGRMKIV